MAKSKPVKTAAQVEVFCNHEVETSLVEMRLVFDCKECALEANLKQNQCMSGVLKALEENFNADSVILSDYAEMRYSGPSMKMMKSLVRLSGELDNLSMRNPVREHFASLKPQSARDKQAQVCNACNSNPQIIFPGLKKTLLSDMEKFYTQFAGISKQVQAIAKPECQSCKKTTEEALVYMFNLTEDYRAFLYFEGFRVVI